VTLIFANAVIVPILGWLYLKELNLGSLLSTRAKLVGVCLLLFTVGLITMESLFCQALLSWHPLPYHVPFDITFFQVFGVWLLYTAYAAQVGTANTSSNTLSSQRSAFVLVACGVALLTMNVKVFSRVLMHPWPHIPLDLVPGTIFAFAAALTASIIDMQALFRMFFDLRIVAQSPGEHLLSRCLGHFLGSRTIAAYVVTLNWMAALGVLYSALWLSLANPITNYSKVEPPSPEVAYKIVSGDLQLNSLARQGSEQFFESYYGTGCAFYLAISFVMHSAESAGIRKEWLWKKGIAYLACVLVLGIFGGYFLEGTRLQAGTIFMLHGLLPWLLYKLQSPPNRMSETSNEVSLPKMMGILCGVSMVCAIVLCLLKSLPGTTDSDKDMSQHSDPAQGIHLQFCEEPYHFTSWASQGFSMVFHLPYIPVLGSLIGFMRGCRPTDNFAKLLVLQTVFQCWTSFGHYLPDPRVWKITECSIMLTCVWLTQYAKATSDFPAWLDVKKVILGWMVWSLMMFYFFGLVTLIFANAVIVPIFGWMYQKELNLGSLLSTRAKLVGVCLLVFTVGLITMESLFCQALLSWFPLPYHAPFDITFFQVFGVWLLYTAHTAQTNKLKDV